MWGGGGEKPSIQGGCGGEVLHVTCDARCRTWLRYFSQKSCVKIWFGLVEASKSYRGRKTEKRKKKKNKIKKKKKSHAAQINMLWKNSFPGA